MTFTPDSLPDLSGRVYLVTGGNTGIGFHTVLQLAKHHARVYLGTRSEARGAAAIASIKETVPDADVQVLMMDLMNLGNVVAAAKELAGKETHLHGIVNNAGIMAVKFEMTVDGFESQFQTNYLSHWVLTYHLLPMMLSTARASGEGVVRIVNVTSNGHNVAPSPGIDFGDINQLNGGVWSRYGQSKLGNILHAKELAKRYGRGSVLSQDGVEGPGNIWTASVHPGSVDTSLNTQTTGVGIMRYVVQPILKCLSVYETPEKGAYTSLFAIASQDFDAECVGEYFTPVAKKTKPSKNARDAKLAAELWDWTEKEMKDRGFLQ